MTRAAIAIATALAGCAVEPSTDLCARLAPACGGALAGDWERWCRSECVPEHARTVPCALNDRCVLCGPEEPDDRVTLFALPVDALEYLWTTADDEDEPAHPPTPRPTGGAIDDRWEGDGLGAWRPYDPFPSLAPDAPGGRCEPGPNRFLAANVSAGGGALHLRGARPALDGVPFCAGATCIGPYDACGAPPSGCQYGDLPEAEGIGEASQLDRVDATGALPTYGHGRYGAILRASGEGDRAQPGLVYAFYLQGHAPCGEDGRPDLDTNTSEIDVEINSGGGDADGLPFCASDEMCLQLSTWVSSTQGVPLDEGVSRQQLSGFRFRDPADAAVAHGYGWDWQEDRVRFTFDRDPRDCDELSERCPPASGALAICEHRRFVPRRPAPLHLQVWGAWWAGVPGPTGSRGELIVERVWHEPTP